jgi:hypothetical protein
MPRSWPRQQQSVSAFRVGDGGRHGTPRRRDGHYLRLWNAAGDCLVVADVGGHTTNSPLGIPILSGAAFISLPQQWAAFEREQLCKQVQQSVTLGGR